MSRESYSAVVVGTGFASSLFLLEREKISAGSAVVCALEGTRPLLVEVQALVAQQVGKTPFHPLDGPEQVAGGRPGPGKLPADPVEIGSQLRFVRGWAPQRAERYPQRGGHTDGPNWPVFLEWASRYVKSPAKADPSRRRPAAATST